jgi:hypothetical protein
MWGSPPSVGGPSLSPALLPRQLGPTVSLNLQGASTPLGVGGANGSGDRSPLLNGGAQQSIILSALMGNSGAPTSTGSNVAVCKYFLNGGCLRGEGCQFLHEIPDERHLDVNGVGFVFNSNAQNTGGSAAQSRVPRSTGPVKRVVARYIPPEPRLESNLPPALAPAFISTTDDLAVTLQKLLLPMTAPPR